MKTGLISCVLLIVLLLAIGYYGSKEFFDLTRENQVLQEELFTNSQRILELEGESAILIKERDDLNVELEKEKKNIKVQKETIYVDVLRVKELTPEEQIWMLRGWLAEENEYPKRLSIDKDIVVALTDNQVRDVNITKTERDGYLNLSDSLESHNLKLLDRIEIGDKLLSNCQESSELEKRNSELLRTEVGKLSKKNDRLKVQRGVLGGASLGMGIALGIMILL